MRLPRSVMSLGVAFASITVAIRDASVRIHEFASLCLAAAFALFRPEPMVFAGAGYVDFTGTGEPLDRALQHSLRHEAAVPRYAAPRKT